MSELKQYTLGNVRVGTCIKNGVFQFQPIFKSPVTYFLNNFSKETSMTGQSRYAHNEMMNKGSLGVHGAYAGVVNVKTNISGYVGNAVAESSKSVKVNYNASLLIGQENLRTKDFTVDDFINALKGNVKDDITSVLDKYNNFMELVNNMSDEHIIDTYNNDSQQKEDLKRALGNWIKSVNEFNDIYGEGVVVGVTWGAFGILEFEMTSSDRATSWKYGAEVDFSVASAGSAFALKAAYDGSQSSQDAKVDVKVQSVVKGKVIEKTIGKWEDKFNNEAFSALAEVNVLSKLPELKIPEDRIPKSPEFVKPEKDKSLTEKIGKIKSLEQLETLAKIQAYEKAKEDNENLTLEGFLNGEAINPADRNDLEIQEIIDGFEIQFAQNAAENKMNAPQQLKNTPSTPEVKPNNSDGSDNTFGSKLEGDFVPLGAIICNWADLFPWLSKATDNRLNDIDELKETLQWRSLIQDAQTISILYYSAHEENMVISNNTSPLQIADEFSQMVQNLQSELKDQNYKQAMTKAISKLGPSAYQVLKTWCTIGFLRDAELGFGVIETSNNNKDSKSLTFQNSWTPCGYDNSSKNYAVYSSFQKVLPIIMPDDGAVRMFSNGGFLGTTTKAPSVISPLSIKTEFKPKINMRFEWKSGVEKISEVANFKAYDLEVDIKNKRFKVISRNPYKHTYHYPIPLSAAIGNNWKGGMAGSPNLKSFSDLSKTLEDLRKDLKRSTKWSFAQPSYDGIDYSPETGLNKLKVNQYYVGVVEKPESGVFERTSLK